MATFIPTIISVDTWFNLEWTDTSAYFLSEYNYKLYINNIQSNSTMSIISTQKLQFSSVLITDKGLYTIKVIGSNGTFTYNTTASSQINVNCFLKGTEILTSTSYVAIENLKIGDEIQTYKNGIKKIKYISKRKFKNSNTLYSQICKITNLPNQTKDLFITGGHAILVDELSMYEKEKTLKYWNELQMIDDKYLLLACISDYEKLNDNNIYELYHLILENDDINKQYGIYANGVLTESMNEKCYTSMFINLQVK